MSLRVFVLVLVLVLGVVIEWLGFAADAALQSLPFETVPAE